jgi:hypothetical protein
MGIIIYTINAPLAQLAEQVTLNQFMYNVYNNNEYPREYGVEEILIKV